MVKIQLIHEKGNPLSELSKERVEKVVSEFSKKVEFKVIDSESKEAKDIMQFRRIFITPLLIINGITQDIGPPSEEDIRAEIKAAIREESG